MNELQNLRPWREIIYQDEPLFKREPEEASDLPEPLREARRMENSGAWEARQAIFLRQGQFLAAYEDDYDYDGDPVRYYPTYQSFSNSELRGYFAWRTKVRRGDYAPAPLSFIFLYIYELINQIGVSDPEAGYARLVELNVRYGASEAKIASYLGRWLVDYAVYYNLDKSLLADSVQVSKDECIGVLERVQSEPPDRIIDAIRQLAPRWLGRSRFYASHYGDMNAVICRVFRRLEERYAKGYKKNMVEQFFGLIAPKHIHIFSAAIFCNPLQRLQHVYQVDDQCVYRCEDGIWSISRRHATPRSQRKLENLLKTIDSLMRAQCGFAHPVRPELGAKWLLKLIAVEIGAWQAEKTAREERRIDFASLAKIRADAASTRDRLLVDEEADSPPAMAPAKDSGEAPLAAAEYRLLQCLLYARPTDWLKSAGIPPSVLVDGINEKLYDMFGDTVIEEGPELVPDYIAPLKEIIQP